MRKELRKYIYQTDEALFEIFMNGEKGDIHLREFIQLLKEEEVAEEKLNYVFKEKVTEDEFIKFMGSIREKLVPEEVIKMSPGEVEEIKGEIERVFYSK